jgi:protein-L-isoaspartate(D-aspartate) O-methyltransferase
MLDTYRQKGLRKRMIRSLKKKGIKDQRILDAMWKIPRHYFLENAFDEWAYKDQAFRIDCEQTISQPYTVAKQTELLEIKEGDKVLEVGTGSGYQASILAEMGAEVFSIERIEELFQSTAKRLRQIGYKLIRLYLGDGYQGLPKKAPFDKIIVTAGAKDLPKNLLHQLKKGGIMVVPIGENDEQIMYRITKLSDKKFKRESFGRYKFVPMLKGINRHDGP